MPTFDLLDAVQPPTGWFCIVGIKDGMGVRQRLVATREEADQAIADFNGRGYNTYFAIAKFATDKNRTKDNVESLKSFWLDIDCGEDKAAKGAGYATQAEGAAALRAFCKTAGLPKPIIVNSGRGLHVYWALEEPVTREEWEPVSASLQALCVKHGLLADPACFEAARILRVPGTLNYKDDPPVEVAVLVTAPPVTLDNFSNALGAPAPVAVKPLPSTKRELTPLAQSLRDNMGSSFAKIMRRSAAGDGCKQLQDCYDNRADLPEPRWFDALSVANRCDDRDTAIHKLSEGYADYDRQKTEDKTKHIGGPHTCAVFEKNNPGGCDDCPFKGKISGPIQLGDTLREAPAEAVITGPPDPTTGEIPAYVVPKVPFPYMRGEGGGIFKDSGTEEPPEVVFEYDFYVVKTMRDPVMGHVVLFRLHMPHEPVAEFSVPIASISDRQVMRAATGRCGLASGEKQFTLLMDFVTKSVKVCQHSSKAEAMRQQFGWADNDGAFIVGDREFRADGAHYSPPSSVTDKLSEMLRPVGSYDRWKEVVALYGRPGMEAQAFAFLTAFGSPLLKFTGMSGGIINLIHPSSGTGKTTTLHMCNSVWGNPKKLCVIKDDKALAKIQWLGMLCNLPYTVDEITNLRPEEFSDLIYNITQGRGRERMQSSGNALRVNNTTWQTIALCSSNSSFAEKMQSLKASPDGELMRMIEYGIGPSSIIDPALGKDMFDHTLLENYGHAGPVYAQHLVREYESVKELVLSTQRKYDVELGLTPRERVWSAITACNMSGGLLAKALNILPENWNIPRIYDWAGGQIKNMRTEIEPPKLNAAANIGAYINRHMQNIVVIKDEADARSGIPAMPSMEPRGELLIRYEPDTKRLYIAAGPFKKDCVEYQISYKDTLLQLQEVGVFLGTEGKRLSKGMKIMSPNVHCLVFDGGSPNFFSMDEMVPVEAPDVGGEG
jgi:hypothetical protein